MSSWQGKTRGGTAGYKAFICLLKYFNLRIAYVALRFVAFYFLFFSPRAFKSVYRFYRYRLAYGPAKSLVSVYGNFYSLGQSLLDKVALLAGFAQDFTFDVEEEINIRRMIEEGNGGILIGAHTGNWEIAGHLLNRLDGTFNVVLLDSEHKGIKDLLAAVGVKPKLRVIGLKDDSSHIFEIHNALMNREFICIHGDRFIPGSKSVRGRLFGGSVVLPYGVFFLAITYHVPISFVFGVKTGLKSYRFCATPPKYYDDPANGTGRDENIQRVVNDFAAHLESMVISYPNQWFNYHDIFSTD